MSNNEERKEVQRFREEVYLAAMAALIQAHPDWLEASIVTSAERMANMSIRPRQVEPERLVYGQRPVSEVAA